MNGLIRSEPLLFLGNSIFITIIYDTKSPKRATDMKYNFDEIVDRKNSNCLKYDAMNTYINASEDSIPMWVADMDFKAAPCIIDALQKKLDHGVFGYGIKPKQFYNSIAQWLNKKHQWPVDPKWISFSPGVVAGFTLAIEKFTKPGDKIIVQPPVYFPFFHSIIDTKRELVNNPLKLEKGRLNIDFDDLKQKITSEVKMLILCNPHNPGGSVWKKEELKKLSEICIENNILVVSDEIHADIVFSPYKHIPYASVSEKAAQNSITVISHSKTFNVAGLTTSYVVIPNKKLLANYNKALSIPHLGMGNVFGTEALIAAYTHGDDWVEELVAYLQENIKLVHIYIRENIPDFEVIVPESTFLVWIDCRKTGWNKNQIQDFFFNKAKVAINPGEIFGEGGEGFIRLNIGCPKSIVQKALEQIKIAYDQTTNI